MRALTIALCLFATPALADVTGPASVIDGDTKMQADAMLDKGDLDGYAAWKRIVKAVGELQGTAPKPGGAVH